MTGGAASARGAPDGPWRPGFDVHLCHEGDGDDPAMAGLAITRRVRIRQPGDWRPAVASAIAARADILVLGSGSTIGPEGLDELRRCAASDPMIAVASPRFDDPGVRAVLARHLPPYAYVPLPDPRCLYLKTSVLADIGSVDAIPDWDRYALAINRYGFRCAVANRAGADRPPAAMPPLARRIAPLEADFPGTTAAVASFLSDPSRDADRLLAGLAPDPSGRLRIAFDATHLSPSHSGTADLARRLIRHAAETLSDRFDIAVIASQAVHAFHFPGAAPLRRVAPEAPETFGALVRIGQPFGWKEIDHAVRRAPLLVFFLLDTIGLDCIRLASDDLDALWRFTIAEADGLLFNSDFTRRQFERRFGLRPDCPAVPSLHPIDLDPLSEPAAAAGSILVIGNGFPHKRVAETARLLAARRPEDRVVALGLAPGTVPGVVGVRSGHLDDAALAALYREARVVVYPSVYEGFGFPVVDALRHRRPVLLRRLPPFEEIAAALPDAADLHWFETDDDLVRLLSSDLRWTGAAGSGAARSWDDSVEDLRHVLDEAVRGVSYARVLRRLDFMRGRVAWARVKRFDAAGGSGEAAERLAAAAGRLTQGAVWRLATSAPGRLLVRWAARSRR